MSHMGKSHLVIMFTVGPDDVAEGDRLFASHGEFMKGHPREGDVALLDYSVSKGPELSNPLDPNSEPTGNTIFVIDEYYESPAGIARHWQDTTENWPEMSSAAPACSPSARSRRCTTAHPSKRSRASTPASDCAATRRSPGAPGDASAISNSSRNSA